jgi:hypothetical protein
VLGRPSRSLKEHEKMAYLLKRSIGLASGSEIIGWKAAERRYIKMAIVSIEKNQS